jgi:endo-1,4-beta-xylanase
LITIPSRIWAAVSVASPVSFSRKAAGKVTYARVAKGSSAALSVSAKTGKVTVKKGTKKGTYKVVVKVTAAGDANRKSATKTLTCKVTVK